MSLQNKDRSSKNNNKNHDSQFMHTKTLDSKIDIAFAVPYFLGHKVHLTPSVLGYFKRFAQKQPVCTWLYAEGKFLKELKSCSNPQKTQLVLSL